MIKRRAPEILEVYLQNKHVGKLISDNATLSFAYDKAYLQDKDAVKISASLPLQEEAFDHQTTSSFFSGLLPDGDVRTRLAKYLKITEKNTFALLKEIGGECAGAISVYPKGASPNTNNTQTYRVLSDKEADQVLSALDKRPMLAGEEDVRMSGAGAQNKLMVAFVDGKIAIPTGVTPSTHIIKPPIKDLYDTVQNEYFCLKLAKAIGLPVPEVSIYWLKGKPYYLIERYDRIENKDGSVLRLHQEDFCQAMQFPPETKYENEGGPSLVDCFDLLNEHIRSGFMAGKNKVTLLKGVIFNYIIGNGDAHGKNYSILYTDGAEIVAPFYDLMSTIVYSNPRKATMAMKLGNKYKFSDVTIRQWEQLAAKIGVKPSFMKGQLLQMSNDIAKMAASLFVELNKDEKTASSIYEKILGVIAVNHRRASNFIQET